MSRSSYALIKLRCEIREALLDVAYATDPMDVRKAVADVLDRSRAEEEQMEHHDIDAWYRRRSAEAQEAYAQLQAARERHWAAIDAGESPLIIRQLEYDVRRAEGKHERAAYVGD